MCLCVSVSECRSGLSAFLFGIMDENTGGSRNGLRLLLYIIGLFIISIKQYLQLSVEIFQSSEF